MPLARKATSERRIMGFGACESQPRTLCRCRALHPRAPDGNRPVQVSQLAACLEGLPFCLELIKLSVLSGQPPGSGATSPTRSAPPSHRSARHTRIYLHASACMFFVDRSGLSRWKCQCTHPRPQIQLQGSVGQPESEMEPMSMAWKLIVPRLPWMFLACAATWLNFFF